MALRKKMPEYKSPPTPPRGTENEYLKITNIEPSSVYTCRLSGNKVFIPEQDKSRHDSIVGIYFANGEYRENRYYDFMLY